MREAQNLKEAGTRGFGFVDAIREGRRWLNRGLGGGCFTENAVKERPRG